MFVQFVRDRRLLMLALALAWPVGRACGDVAPPPLPPSTQSFSDDDLKIQVPGVVIAPSEPGSVPLPARLSCLLPGYPISGTDQVVALVGAPTFTYVSGDSADLTATSDLSASLTSPLTLGRGYWDTNGLFTISVDNALPGGIGAGPYNQSTYDVGWTLCYRPSNSQSYVDLPFTVRVTALGTAPLPGDAELDGTVDANDLSILLANFGLTSMVNWSDGDFIGSGSVDINDLTILLANYGDHAQSPRAAAVLAPEPSSLIVAGLGIIVLLLAVWQRWSRSKCAPRWHPW